MVKLWHTRIYLIYHEYTNNTIYMYVHHIVYVVYGVYMTHTHTNPYCDGPRNMLGFLVGLYYMYEYAEIKKNPTTRSKIYTHAFPCLVICTLLTMFLYILYKYIFVIYVSKYSNYARVCECIIQLNVFNVLEQYLIFRPDAISKWKEIF